MSDAWLFAVVLGAEHVHSSFLIFEPVEDRNIAGVGFAGWQELQRVIIFFVLRGFGVKSDQ